jgi:DNA polymerase-3 subunit epsilon
MIVIFLDTETNGLPLNRYAPYTATEMWPHVIQISWQVVDTDTWSVLKEEDHLLLPRATWNADAERIHQIPESLAKKFGKSPLDVFKKLHADLESSGAVIAHNMNFDKTAIMCEIQRLYLAGTYNLSPVQFWSSRNDICTMVKTKQLCGLKFKDGNDLKFPRLNELYLKLFGVEYDISGAALHNSKHDVGCLIMCVRELMSKPEFADLLRSEMIHIVRRP